MYSLTVGVSPSVTAMLFCQLGHPFRNISHPKEPNESSAGRVVNVSHELQETDFIQVRVGLSKSSPFHSRAHPYELQFHVALFWTVMGNKCQLLASWLYPTSFSLLFPNLIPHSCFMHSPYNTIKLLIIQL